MRPVDITFIIEKIPRDTPKNSRIFITGDFCGWFPDIEFYEAKMFKDNTYRITIRNLTVPEFEYKFTRGSWQTAECNSKGYAVKNRVFKWDGKKEVRISIAGWEDVKHTASENVWTLTDKFCIPQLNTYRKIWLYLPPGYYYSNKRYPVVYMHDAQNLFDSYHAVDGEWEVDKTLDKMCSSGHSGAIIVGIENGGKNRRNEYLPQYCFENGKSKAKEFLTFIAYRLKKYIDKYYRTLPDKKHTGMIGAGEAGTFTLYSVFEMPDIFGNIASFSPDIKMCPQLADAITNVNRATDNRFYFLTGIRQPENLLQKLQTIEHMLKVNGLPINNIKINAKLDGESRNWFWKREFAHAYRWLFY